MGSFIVTFQGFLLCCSSDSQSVYLCVSLDLEVRVLNTETDSQDLSFPQNGPSDTIIQLRASTYKQYSRNGQSQLRLSLFLYPFHYHPWLFHVQFH